jgi:HlyD family secretion protein
MSLVTIMVLIGMVIGWGFGGEISVKTYGEGIILAGGGVHSVTHPYEGVISEIDIEVGDYVEKGAIVGLVRNIELEEDLLIKKERLEALYKLEPVMDEKNILLGSHLYNDLSASISLIESHRGSEIDLLNLKKNFQIKKQVYIQELSKEIDLLETRINRETSIISPIGGRVLEAEKSPGDLLRQGEKIITVLKESQGNKDLEVIMYIPIEEGKSIHPNMAVQLSPTTVNKDKYGFVQGRVVEVGDYSASKKGMMNILGNEEIVEKLSSNSASIEVVIDLIEDKETISGYKWSSQDGPPIQLENGTLCSGSITLEKRKPISFVLPFIN